jgi:hypothetical protein
MTGHMQRDAWIPIGGTLLKTEVEIQRPSAGQGVKQSLQRGWRWSQRPGPPAAAQETPGIKPGIKPALHGPQRPWPGGRWGGGRWGGGRQGGAGVSDG